MLAERVFFLVESIEDILNLETNFGHNNDIKDGIQNLQREITRILPFVRGIEVREDKHLEERFSLEISGIVEDGEDIIGGLAIGKDSTNLQKEEMEYNRRKKDVTSPTNRRIKALIKRIQMCCSGIVKEGKDINGGLIIGKDSTNLQKEEVEYNRRKKDVISPTNHRIKALIERIQMFCRETSSAPVYNFSTGNCENYGHQQKTGSINVYTGVNSPPLIKHIGERRSYGHVKNCDLVGFRQETETLLHQLIKNNKTRVVGIVGMGGLGKTTLAKHLYHHDDIKNHFDHRVWICVSQTWNKRDILYEILENTKGAPMGREMVKDWSDEEFAKKLYAYLSTKKYLVVLDDVWAVDAWNNISPALPPSEKGKFLITTRNEAVPKLVDLPFFVLEPEPLNPKESFELFYKRAFTDGLPSSEIMDLGKNMVLKCKGLPLAITALAGALRGKKLLSDWIRVNETLAQRIMKVKDSTTKAMVNEILALSYHDLPHYIKSCFLYLRIFPEDYVIGARELMRMWIAECLITQEQLSEDEKMLRAEEYLDELIQRYMVQDVERNYIGQVKRFQMHDLIREVCIENAQKESHRVSLCFKSKSQFHMEQEYRDSINRFFHPASSSRLRSLTIFFPFGLIPVDELQLFRPNMLSLFDKFTFLRVLVLFHYSVKDWRLPEAVGNLIHLRYLGLRGYGSMKLPENIGNLQNLLILDLERLDEGLSENLWKLKRLRHLHFRYKFGIYNLRSPMVLRLDSLENLQTLRNLEGGDWMLSEMSGLSPTLHKLSIRGIRSQEQLDAVFHCPSIKLDNLQTLELTHYGAELQNMETLKRCEKLQKLT